jgi:hypothetical protein
VAEILTAFGGDNSVGVATDGDGGIDYLYAPGHILVRTEYLVPVVAVLLGREFTREAGFGDGRFMVERVVIERFGVRPVVEGVVVLPLAGFKLSVPGALTRIDDSFGPGVATPDHVLTVAGEVTPCPATEPEQVDAGIEPNPGVCRGNSGAGVHIYIADTGWLPEASAHPWLAGVEGELDPNSPQPNAQGVLSIKHYGGHGTFVAGVARCLAREADVYVANVFSKAGSRLESEAVPELVMALRGGVDIFHLSVAAPSRLDLPLLSFEAWLRLVRQYSGVVVVAAAGNWGRRRPAWPAAFSEVVAVGALEADRHDRASFSNHGGWVDVYAPGRNLVNAYATGTYKCYVKPHKGDSRVFYGMARWSGTSFSSPIVTGLIADRMSRTGENGRQAAAALILAGQSQAIPGVGAVLVPCRGKENPHGA